jgi:SAM-dependent methyltransferase
MFGMASDPADLSTSGTERSALASQYKDPTNLENRVSIYTYLQPEQPLPTGTTFEDWVLGHYEWHGTETAIDVGCGPGGFLEALHNRSALTIGLDLSPGMVAGALRHNSAIETRVAVADIEMLPLRSDVADVVVAAFMLYHVPDLNRGLSEIRRVLRRNGVLLAVTNGVDDKHEIRELWQAAGRRIVGPGFKVPRWGDRFNLDGGAQILRGFFGVVEVDRTRGTFRFPHPDPVIRWVDSLRDGWSDRIDDSTWGAVLAALRSDIANHIEHHGSFDVAKDSGVLLART